MVKDLRTNTSVQNYISFEGLEGCGKTFYLKYLRQRNPSFFILLDEELSDFGVSLFHVLKKRDGFFRSTQPLREFLGFSMIDLDQIHTCVLPALAHKKVVLQDRGADTTCLYAAIQLSEQEKRPLQEVFHRLFSLRSQFGPVPSHVLLILDDFRTCIERAEQRNGKRYTSEEHTFLQKIDAGFRALVSWYPQRIVTVDRTGKSVHDMVLLLEKKISTFL